MKVIVKESALKDFKKLDKQWQKIVVIKLEEISNWSNEIMLSQAIKLSGLKKTLYRIRARDDRIIFSIEYQDNTIILLRILDRKDAYKSTYTF